MKFNSVQINMKQVSHNVTVVLYAMVLSFFKKIKCSFPGFVNNNTSSIGYYTSVNRCDKAGT